MNLQYFIFVILIICIAKVSFGFVQENENPLECFRFPQNSIPISYNPPDDVLGSKTSYMKARQLIRQKYNSTFPLDSQSCSPIYMFYFGRHTIRFPMEKEVVKFQKEIPSIQQELLSGGRLNENLDNELKHWQLLMHLSENARVTLSGQLDTSVQGKYILVKANKTTNTCD